MIVQTPDWGESLVERQFACSREGLWKDENFNEFSKGFLGFGKPAGFDENKIATAIQRIGIALRPTVQRAALATPQNENRHSTNLAICFAFGNVLPNAPGKRPSFVGGTTWSNPSRANATLEIFMMIMPVSLGSNLRTIIAGILTREAVKGRELDSVEICVYVVTARCVIEPEADESEVEV